MLLEEVINHRIFYFENKDEKKIAKKNNKQTKNKNQKKKNPKRNKKRIIRLTKITIHFSLSMID